MTKKIRFSGLGLAGLVMLFTSAACFYMTLTEQNYPAAILGAVLLFIAGDCLAFEGLYLWFNNGLKDRFTLWRKRRFWNMKKQHEHLRIMIQSDNQWMSNVPAIEAITQRYLDALSPDWYTISFEPTSKLRDRLKLDPIMDSADAALVITAAFPDRRPAVTVLRLTRRLKDKTLKELEEIYTQYVRDMCKKDLKWEAADWSMNVVEFSGDMHLDW